MSATIPTQHSPRFPIAHFAPGCMCECGHREGSHNDIGRCCSDQCSCGGYPYAPREEWAGFRPVEGSRCQRAYAAGVRPSDYTSLPEQEGGTDA